MNRTAITLAGLGAASLSLAACYPPHPHMRRDEPLKVVTSLDCPNDEGSLTRTALASDGKSCTYTSDMGAQVTLQLVAITAGDPRAALTPIETQLRTEVTSPPADIASGAAPAAADSDRVDIDLPGIHIHANGHDQGSSGQVSINGDDHGGQVRVDKHVTIGGDASSMSSQGVTINAGDKGAEIRVNEKGSGLRYRFILASDTPGPHGFKYAGYEARGPASGPLVVASVLAKSNEHDDGDLDHDVHKLVEHNAGG